MSLGLRIFMALEVSLCYVPGLLLRLFPFIPHISSKQKKMLAVAYPLLILLNMLLLFAGLSDFERATALVRLDMLVIQLLLVGVNVVVMKKYWKEHLFTFGLVATCMYMLLSSASYVSTFFFHGRSALSISAGNRYIHSVHGYLVLTNPFHAEKNGFPVFG